MLALKNITKTYNPGTIREMCLFNDFSVTFEKGEFVSIVGSNGSGKTSLLNIICGSIGIEQGQVVIDDRDITKEKEFVRARYIGRIHQNPAVGTCGSMTLLENLSLADNKDKRMGLRPGTDKARIEAYRNLLRPLDMGLENMLNARADALSGGQRQALALVMSIMTPVEYLILDEHTAALDPRAADTIMAMTDRIVKEKNLTAIMVTHNLRYAVEHGTRLIMMHQGNIVVDKSGQEKDNTHIDDLLKVFNEISIECGN